MVEPKDGDTIFSEGDPGDAVYAVISGDGRVRIGSSDAHSKSLMAQMLGVGEIFGEIGVIDGGNRTADAVAIGSVRLWRIGAVPFRAALATEPALGMALTRMLAERLRRTHLLLRDATFAPLTIRLARQLLYLAATDGRAIEQGRRIARRLRQSDLADLLGATTRSIITILNEWRAAGLVAYDGNRALVTILNEDKLRAIVSDQD